MIALIKKLIQRIMGRDLVAYICGAESLPNPLSAEEEIQLAQKAKDGDDNAREKLIEHNLRLVIFIAKKFENTNIDTEDLISIGTIGLIKAVNGFDPTKKIKLATFASRCIENEILMFLRKSIRLKTEVSLDEPLNTDGEGNE
ncbi:MAG: sigma-70 family RNA polymerase sigma factor, partial [Clostridia bacterium]|nr:sigma-70 family RNA polymerase sigma factor [Clostridia bacterium]